MDSNLIQRPQKERKKKTREGPKKKSENSLNTNSSSEDLQAPKPKYIIYKIRINNLIIIIIKKNFFIVE